MTNRCRLAGNALRRWYPWGIASLVVLSSNWAATVLFDAMNLWMKGEPWIPPGSRLLFVIIFAVSVCLLYRQRGAFFRPHTRRLSNEPAEPRKHLVIFLSSLPRDLERWKCVPRGLDLSHDLDGDLLAMEELKQGKPPVRWPWEMPLRAIRHHSRDGTLETVILICSRQSILQSGFFLDVCRRYQSLGNVTFSLLAQQDGATRLISPLPGPGTETPVTLDGWDFESFDELSRALWFLLRELEKRKIADREVMIDFTGGQKVTSVVAAAMTFNREMKAQYVQTNPRHDVLSYDVVLASSDTSGIGI